MAKTLKEIAQGYEPKSPDEKRFKDKHTVKKTPDADKNGDDVFNASKVKTVKRSKERHGYDAGADEKVYEEKMTSSDKSKEKKLKAKYDDSGMKSSMQKQYGAEKGKQVYFATIRKQAMESVELAESDTDNKMWNVSYDHGPHQSNTIKVKAKSQSHAWEVAKEVAKKEHGHSRITSGGVTPVKESLEVTEGLKYAQVEPKDVKSVLAAHRATGESARHMGGGKIAYSGKKLVTGTQNEAVELDEGDYDDMIAAFKAKGGTIKKVAYNEPDEKQKAKLGASWTRGGGGKGGSSAAGKEYASMNKKDTEHNAKQSAARKRAMGESVEELDEGVAQDTYNMHHKRAMKAVEDLAKHLMKHKANCDKSTSKWAHSDNIWQMKNMSTQLEDMVHNIASQNEATAERNNPVVDRG